MDSDFFDDVGVGKMSDASIKSWLDRDGALLRLRLATPKANKHLLAKSAIAIRITLKGVHRPYAQRIIQRFPEVEKLCAGESLATHDTNEGMKAFLEKRKPIWRNC